MIKKLFFKLNSDSIYANSSYLLSSWALLSAFGFGFWTICTNLYSDEQVGIATALLAALNLITSLSLMGFEISLIRVLPKYHDKSHLLNVCISTSALVGIAVSMIFFLVQPVVSSDLDVIHSSLLVSAFFVLFVVVSVGSYLLENTFISYRKSKYVLRKNLIFSLAKLVLPFVFIGLGAFGIYSAWMFSLLIAVLYSMVVLTKNFGHSFRATLGLAPLRGMMKYSFGNYVATFAEGLPIMVLPVLTIDLFGPVETAHYYIAMMLATFLFTVSTSATQSMFAEGSHSDEKMSQIIFKALKFSAVFLIPGIIVTVLLGSFILSIFGEGYADQSTGLLSLLAISSVLVALNSIARTIFRIHYRTKALMIIGFVGSFSIIGFSYLLQRYSLNGIGFAWIIGQGITLLAFGYLIFRGRSELISG